MIIYASTIKARNSKADKTISLVIPVGFSGQHKGCQ